MTSPITLRPATIDDLDLLLTWRNDPLTRKASHNTKEINKKEHEQWLKASLGNANRQIYIAEKNGIAVGTLRTDFSENAYLLSWAVAPTNRNHGIGKQMVAKLANQIKNTITAEIKVGNTASIKIAENCGMRFEYEKDGILHYQHPAKIKKSKK